MLALAVRAQSQAGGVSKTNAYINVLDAFTTHVLPEIQVGGEERRDKRRGELVLVLVLLAFGVTSFLGDFFFLLLSLGGILSCI